MTALRRGWFHLASGAGAGRTLSFVSNLLLSRWLSPRELGLFNLITATVQTSDTLVRCGGDYALNFELGGQPEATSTSTGSDLARGLAQLCSLMTALLCVAVVIWVWMGDGLFPSSLAASQRLSLTFLLILMIGCEGLSASAWEVLLVSHRTGPLALRQGLFFPLRLLFAAFGALFDGVPSAMVGWSLISVVQCIWLKHVLGALWNPFQIFPPLVNSLTLLLRRGFPFYAANLLASMIFYPLLLKVASVSGLTEIGYLRVGQILQQLFAFLPATFVPVFFLRLRSEMTFDHQVSVLEMPLRLVWSLLLAILLLYCAVDHYLIVWLFGVDYAPALLPTRLILITALLEGLSQLIVQPLLAAGKTLLYGFWQNSAALLAAVLGWLWIPTGGLPAYLIVRLLFSLVPLLAYFWFTFKHLRQPRKLLPLCLSTSSVIVILVGQSLYGSVNNSIQLSFLVILVLVLMSQYQDLPLIKQLLRS